MFAKYVEDLHLGFIDEKCRAIASLARNSLQRRRSNVNALSLQLNSRVVPQGNVIYLDIVYGDQCVSPFKGLHGGLVVQSSFIKLEDLVKIKGVNEGYIRAILKK